MGIEAYERAAKTIPKRLTTYSEAPDSEREYLKSGEVLSEDVWDAIHQSALYTPLEPKRE